MAHHGLPRIIFILMQSLSQRDIGPWLIMIDFHMEIIFALYDVIPWLIFILRKYFSECDIGPWLTMIINPRVYNKTKN